jgi:DNA-directed RNA polymerase specialized sigma24 family protein
MTSQLSQPSDSYAGAARQQRREQSGRNLCDLHARPLLSLAVLLLDDPDTASEVVSDTIASACDAEEYTSIRSGGRVQLARSVYRRCLGRLAVRERFGPVPGRARPERAARRSSTPVTLDTDRVALVALVIFGGHDLGQAAATLNLSTGVVLKRLQEILGILGAHLGDVPLTDVGTRPVLS